MGVPLTMLIRIAVPWRYRDCQHEAGEILYMPESLFKHLEEVSIAQEIKDERIHKIASVLGADEFTISDEVKKQINFLEEPTQYRFTLDKVGYIFLKDRAVRLVE